ncbi:MAG: 2Fe-2S iron-sulfur cluster-binding protein [Bacteroidales bacterium]|jgi:ferredoxin
MARITIDNRIIDAEKGETILNAAERAGIRIPYLCHKDGVGHYTSCMVCMVRDSLADKFLPSCTALVSDDMEIDASSEKVMDIRRKAVELLLSEHRAECEAQCRVVCPAGYNVPEINRLLAAGDLKAAIGVILKGLDSPEIRCLTCPGYCENACRRKKIDLPVSIKNILIFVYKNISKDELPASNNNDAGVRKSGNKRFASRIGRLEGFELKEWLKESADVSVRFREISDLVSAGREAENCMHCDCRAADSCKLRSVAEELSVKDPAGKVVNVSIEKKINHKTGLIFENAKCIKCGLCVRICEDSKEEPALCFINRGFISVISEPLTEEFSNILATRSEKCIEVCPTGALGSFRKNES